MQITQLPYVDEHTTDIAADVEDVWPSLTETLDRDFGRAWAATYARLVGCADRASSGPRPLVEGSTIPGFHVVAVVPGQEIVLEGRHHFSSYALTFRLERIDSGRSRLRAETRAAFPGLHGSVYRLLVIGTRGHVVAVRRLLALVRRRSEWRAGSRGAG
jgi:hypothetical protein